MKLTRFAPAVLLASPLMANAAVDAAITAAIADAQANGLIVAGLVTGLAVAIWGALILKRKFFG